MDFRLPNITGESDSQKLSQMQSYLYQLVEQLNYSLATINGETKSENLVKANTNNSGVSQLTQSEIDYENFNSIKALIIKSSEIVEAYYDEIKRQLDGVYVAESEFGTYKEQTSATLLENSTSITQLYTNAQNVNSDLLGIKERTSETESWIKTGLLEEDESGNTIYGMEVGQVTYVNGEETFNKFARFTGSGIYFYLPAATKPVAWMSGQKLYISSAEITGSLTVGGYSFQVSNGLIFKWVGGAI